MSKSQNLSISTSSIFVAFLYTHTQNDKNSNILIAYQETKAGTENITYTQCS